MKQFNNPYNKYLIQAPYIHDDETYKPLKRGSYVAVRTEPKIERNSQCPCGSGKKYKKCCLKV